jgi:hypothetical protein
MAANYLYIAKTMPGEFRAMSELRSGHEKRMLTLFDLSNPHDELARFEHAKDRNAAYIAEMAERIAGIWSGTTLIDAMRWSASATINSGQAVIPYFYDQLMGWGLDVVPVIGYDRWGSDVYRQGLQGIDLRDNKRVCLRLESFAMKDAAEPDFLREQINEIVDAMEVDPTNYLVLIDFEDTTATPLEQMVNTGNSVIEALAGFGFTKYVVAGCSIPPFIDQAIPRHNETGKIMRREWTVFQTFMRAYPQYTWLHGDYGIRGPKSVDAPNKHTNGKIRYTTSAMYFAARGHSLSEGNKGAQMHDLAKWIMDSEYFMGADFSWGDRELVRCAMKELKNKKPFKGNPTGWIAIDTNHHLTWVVQEVEELVMRLARAS